MTDDALRRRITDFLAALHGREPTESEISSALQGYHEARAETAELERSLPPGRVREALQAETSRLIDEINRGPRKPQ